MFGLSKMVSPLLFGQRFPLATRRFQLSALRSYHQVPTTAELDIIVDRAVSEMREGLCEGDGGFDLVLANKKEQAVDLVKSKLKAKWPDSQWDVTHFRSTFTVSCFGGTKFT